MKFLDHLEEWLITFLMGAATLLIFVAVMHRYAAGVAIPGLQDALLKIDLSWAQELCICDVDGQVRCRLRRRTSIHVGVDVMINRLPPECTSSTSCSACSQAPHSPSSALGATFVWDVSRADSVSPDLEIPKWLVYLCIPLGSYLMCFRFLQVAWAFWRTGSAHHGVAHVEGIEPEDINQCVPDLHPADSPRESADDYARPPGPATRRAGRRWSRRCSFFHRAEAVGVEVNNAWVILRS